MYHAIIINTLEIRLEFVMLDMTEGPTPNKYMHQYVDEGRPNTVQAR